MSLQEFFPGPRLVGLVTLVLGIAIMVKQNFLVATFGHLPQLRNVTISGYRTTKNFLLALLHKPDDYNTFASAYYSTYFPALRCLEFKDVSFPSDSPIYSLEDWLRGGRECNAGIRKLVFTICSPLYAFHVQRLREIV